MSTITMFRVGGCVRDELLGVAPKDIHDIDFAVEAPSFDAMHRMVKARARKVFLVTPEFFTIRALDDEFGAVDFVMCRKDGPTLDGRRPAFVEPGTIFDDLARRDFTVNAMAQSMSGTLLDPHRGRRDLEARVLRFVGDPAERLAEDALRAFRALRFAVTKGFRVTVGTHDALRAMQPGDFDAVSTERIREELLRCFTHDTARTLELLTSHRMLLELALERGIWFKPTIEAR